MSNFMNLEIGRKSIIAHQTAISVAGHNLANTNTPGYSRQRATLTQTQPWHAPILTNSAKAGQLGTGVYVESVNRIRDSLVDLRIRTELKTEGMWSAIEQGLARMESIINEPLGTGVRGVLDNFWAAWEDLTLNPENESARAVVIQQGIALTTTFNHTYSQLTDMREDCNAQIKIQVERVNEISREIASLNKSIMAITVSGRNPNDLLDQRDLLVEELSRLGDTTVFSDKNGMITVQFGNRIMVEGVEHYEMTTIEDNQGMSLMIWKDSGLPVRIKSGEIYGYMELRGRTNLSNDPYSELTGYIPWMMNKLNVMAETLVTELNALHSTGYSLYNQTDQPDGSVFFKAQANATGNWALDIMVNPDLEADNTKLVAAQDPTWKDGKEYNFGDNEIAKKIAQLKHNRLIGGNTTIDDYWRGATADLGVWSREAQRMVENQEALLTELDNERQSISGVLIDEEWIDIIKFQHAYNSASRYITTIDEALDTIINRMGLVGR